jgi:hypothetical protein
VPAIFRHCYDKLGSYFELSGCILCIVDSAISHCSYNGYALMVVEESCVSGCSSFKHCVMAV